MINNAIMRFDSLTTISTNDVAPTQSDFYICDA